MAKNSEHIARLFTAELQFRLASAVQLAVVMKEQPIDLPQEWTHGKHRVYYPEIALRQDQAEFAATNMHNSATYLMATEILYSIRGVIDNPKKNSDFNIVSAFQISRMIRNSFTHSPFSPVWSIDSDCLDKEFKVNDIISLNTTGLDKTPFNWRHYGGPLALLFLCRYVRFEILKDKQKERDNIPVPKKIYYQQGDLIFKKVNEDEND